MTAGRLRISEEELHRYIDGELEPARAAEIGKAVEADAVLAGWVAAFRSDKQRLREAYAPPGERPLPEQWLRRIERHSQATRPQRWRRVISAPLATAIAAGLLLLVGWTLFTQYSGSSYPDPIVTEALAARQDLVLPQHAYSAAELPRPESRNEVLSAVLSMKMKAPDLSKMGYRLNGLRVYAGVPGGKAVELDYHNAQDRLFTLYLRRPASPPRVDIIERNGVRICIWQDDVVSAVMAGQMTAGEMARLATLAYAGLYL